MTLPLSQCEHLYRYIWRELTDCNCLLLRIGGIQNHIHMLIDLHPAIALSTLMRNIKSHTAGWLKSDNRFPDFEGWARGYYASTISEGQKDSVIEYIRNQHAHHLHTPFDVELRALYQSVGYNYDDRDMR